MSSAILSPHTPALSLNDISPHAASRPQRNRKPVARPWSPAGTSSSTATPARVTRSRASRSPDKLSAEQKRAEETFEASPDVPETEHVTAADSPFGMRIVVERFAHIDGGKLKSREQFAERTAESINERTTTDEKVQEASESRTGPKIRIRFGPQVENSQPDDDNRSELTEPDPLPPSSRTSPTIGEKRALRVADSDGYGTADARGLEQAIAEVEKEPLKRAPRKKRKWLKRGEVDMDDPAAVAKQQARHRLIDSAILDIDKQLEAIRNETHPSLVWILEELRHRKGLQLARLEARQTETMLELARMRDQAVQQHKADFIDARERLTDAMLSETRNQMGKCKQQSTVHKVIIDTYPAPRDGRGGGGWQFFPSDYLSKHRESLIPAGRYSEGVRRNTSVEVRGIDLDDAKDDLNMMGPRSAHRKRESVPRRRRLAPEETSSASPVPPPVYRATPRIPPYAAEAPSENINNLNPRTSYAAAPASASYAVNPTPVPPRPSRDPEGYVPPFPLYHSAPMGRPEYISWEDYRVYANCDAWGCPLPHDRTRKDLVLRESWEKHKGLIRKEAVYGVPRQSKSQRATGQSRTSSSQRSKPASQELAPSHHDRHLPPPSSMLQLGSVQALGRQSDWGARPTSAVNGGR